MFPGAIRRAVVAFPIFAATAGCFGANQERQPPPATGRILVVAAFYPLYEFSRAVGGDRVEVTNLVSAGVEPHDFDPSPRELERIQRARLLVYIGEGFQPGLERAIGAANAPNLVAIDVVEGMALMEGREKEKDHDDGGLDPHVWLDPVAAKDLVGKVRDALAKVDPAGKDSYAANAHAYLARLDQLDQEFRQGLSSCARREFMTSHEAFGYLARRYSLTQTAISGSSPEAEPSPARLKEIVEAARAKKAKVIFFETLVSPKVAEVVAREIGAQAMVLNPVEGLTAEEQKQGKDYLAIMRQNLANLRIALECR